MGLNRGRKKLPNISEHEEQCVVVEFCQIQKIPFFAIPNGTYLNGTDKQRAMQMYKLKREGLQVGVPDLFIPYPTKEYAGLFIEMKKRTGGKASKEQEEWLKRLTVLGYRAVCCSGSTEAIKEIKEYFRSQ